MKVLCFGDSNTYGYDPRSFFGDRYPAQYRWVDLLAQKLGCEAVNAGENGREIPRLEGELARFHRILDSQKPLDLLIILLGTNDLLQGNSAETISVRMEHFLQGIDLKRSQILLIGVPPMKLGEWVPTQNLIDDAKTLNEQYKSLSARLGIRFADPQNWGISLAFDGVHFTEEGHKAFAEGLYRFFTKGE